MRLFASARDFSFAISPRTLTVRAGKSANYSIRITRDRGFTEPIGFTAHGVPRHVSVGFTPIGSGPDPFRTMIVDVGKHAPVGSHRLKVVGRGGKRTHHHHVMLNITSKR